MQVEQVFCSLQVFYSVHTIFIYLFILEISYFRKVVLLSSREKPVSSWSGLDEIFKYIWKERHIPDLLTTGLLSSRIYLRKKLLLQMFPKLLLFSYFKVLLWVCKKQCTINLYGTKISISLYPQLIIWKKLVSLTPDFENLGFRRIKNEKRFHIFDYIQIPCWLVSEVFNFMC